MTDLDQFTNLMNDIPHAEAFQTDVLLRSHPLCTIIHRRCVGSKENLATARSGSAFTRRVVNADIFVSMQSHNNCSQGMSCFTSCYCANHVRNGNVPLEFLPSHCYRVNLDTDTVFIQAIEYQIVRCYHRQVNSAPEITVGAALNSRGNLDSCMIDANFALFFENSDHALIKLRREARRVDGNFAFSPNNKFVTFNHPFFDLDSWVPCNAIFVIIPIAVILMVLSGKQVENEINKITSAPHRNSINGFISAHNLGDVDKLEGINSALELLFMSATLNSIPYAEREKMVAILDDYASDIWGDEDGYYVQMLRPCLLE